MTGIPNSIAVLPGTLRADTATVSAANTARDGTGVVVTVLLANPSWGSKIDLITIEAQGTVTNGVVRLFLHNGSAYFLWKEVIIPATTPSVTQAAYRVEVSRSDGLPVLLLPPLYSLRASTHLAEAYTVSISGWDY